MEEVSAKVTATQIIVPTNPVVNALTDEPKYSSAALSISLKIADGSLGDDNSPSSLLFRPEYTHQCVGEREVFAGYRPPEDVLEKVRLDVPKGTEPQESGDNPTPTAQQPLILHKSHQWHSTATAELSINISLAPSCECCHVQITTLSLLSQQPSLDEKDDDDNQPNAKRVKFDSETATAKRLSEAEILNAISNALPPIQDGNNDVKEKILTEPIGKVLEEYKVFKDDEGTELDFVISLADGHDPKVADYHQKIQPLALFFIENADNVNVSATDNGYWKVLYVFQKHNNHSRGFFSLVGYFTLFHFIALFHKPQPGIILRICQALILPPFQGQGHGCRLFHDVYQLAYGRYDAHMQQNSTTVKENSSGSNGNGNSDASTSNNQQRQRYAIVQVNVEDPAPAFVALRNKVDYALVQQQQFAEKLSKQQRDVLDATFFTSLTDAQATELSAKIKITVPQIHVVNDLIKLEALQKSKVDENGTNQDEWERLFRLMVKKRLNKEHREELGGLGSKEEQKALLAQLFEERLKGYERIVRSKRRGS